MTKRKVLVTGSCGLIGSEVTRSFARRGSSVTGIDSNHRAIFFGPDGDTSWVLTQLQSEIPDYRHSSVDIRDREAILALVEELRPDLIIHTAAQPSHDRAATIPFLDFEVNALGTLHLLEAVRRLPYADVRLILVGGWKTRSMRRFIERACAEDARVAVRPGDPLGHLASARLSVHPSYEDGFAYAPAEAIACGVPVIVSEDTGMKDLVEVDRTGLILPTGDLDSLTEAIEAAYRGEIFGDRG